MSIKFVMHYKVKREIKCMQCLIMIFAIPAVSDTDLCDPTSLLC